jgi:ectoine hydroxylase
VLNLSVTATALAQDRALTGLAGQLLGGPAHLMENKITYKQRVAGNWPGLRVLGEEVHKHSDAAYFHARGYPDPVVTIAVCLDDCAVNAGPVRVCPGTRRRAIPSIPTENGPVVPDSAAPDAASIPLTAAAGAVLAWDARLVHASGPNTTGRPRRLLVLGYAPTPAR